MVSKVADKSVHLLTMISELHFLLREELSQLSDQLYMLTGTGCLSYISDLYSMIGRAKLV